jgi:hypothetical protein
MRARLQRMPSVLPEVTGELIYHAILVLTIFPRKNQKMQVKRALRACGVKDDQAVAALARLMAADALDGAGLLEQYGEEALLEAIASAPLYRVEDSFLFDPEELRRVLTTLRAVTSALDDGVPPKANAERYV